MKKRFITVVLTLSVVLLAATLALAVDDSLEAGGGTPPGSPPAGSPNAPIGTDCACKLIKLYVSSEICQGCCYTGTVVWEAYGGSGTLRIKCTADPSSLVSVGDSCDSSSFELVKPCGSGSATVYIKGLNPGTVKIKAELFLNGSLCKTDEQSLTVLKVDLEIYDGQNGSAVPEADEETKGAFTVANLNDTDDDGTDDQNDADVPGEQDLMKLILKKPEPDLGGQVTLTLPSSVKLWKSADKAIGEETSTTFSTADLPLTRWVESRQQSGVLRDLVLEMEYHDCKDTVKATAIWCDTPIVRSEQDGDYTPKNSKRPSSYGEEWGPRIDKLGQHTSINSLGQFFAYNNVEIVSTVRPNVSGIPVYRWAVQRHRKTRYWEDGVQKSIETDWTGDSYPPNNDTDQDPDVYDEDSPGINNPNASLSSCTAKGNLRQALLVKVHSGASYSRCSPYAYFKSGIRIQKQGGAWTRTPAGSNFVGTGEIPGSPSEWTE